MKKLVKQVKKGLAALLAVVMVMAVGEATAYARVHPILNDPSMPNAPFEVAYVLEASFYWYVEHDLFEDIAYVMFSDEPSSVGELPYFPEIPLYTFPAGTQAAVLSNLHDNWTWVDFVIGYTPDGWMSVDLASGKIVELTSDMMLSTDNIYFDKFVVDDADFSLQAWSVGFAVGDATPYETQIPTTTNNQISVTINGSAVNFTDQQPTIIDGRTLVPVRGVFEGLGFNVSWNEQARQATLARANDTIVITIDSATFIANGASHTLDVPAQVIGGSTMLPIRAVLEAVGYRLDWNGDTSTVVITTN